MGDQWQVFLIQDKEEKPTAVLLPSSAREGLLSPVTEVWLAVTFGLLSIVSSLQSAGIPLFQFLTNPFYTELSQQVGGGLRGQQAQAQAALGHALVSMRACISWPPACVPACVSAATLAQRACRHLRACPWTGRD